MPSPMPIHVVCYTDETKTETETERCLNGHYHDHEDERRNVFNMVCPFQISGFTGGGHAIHVLYPDSDPDQSDLFVFHWI